MSSHPSLTAEASDWKQKFMEAMLFREKCEEEKEVSGKRLLRGDRLKL